MHKKRASEKRAFEIEKEAGSSDGVRECFREESDDHAGEEDDDETDDDVEDGLLRLLFGFIFTLRNDQADTGDDDEDDGHECQEVQDEGQDAQDRIANALIRRAVRRARNCGDGSAELRECLLRHTGCHAHCGEGRLEPETFEGVHRMEVKISLIVTHFFSWLQGTSRIQLLIPLDSKMVYFLFATIPATRSARAGSENHRSWFKIISCISGLC